MQERPFPFWFKRLVDSIARWLKIQPKREKTFLIHSNPMESRRNAPGTRGGFHIAATTRPQICPVCRTPGGRIERTSGSRFRCRCCDHEWR